MTRQLAASILREELNKHSLQDWHIRLINDLNTNRNYLGMCSHKDKCIILNAHHIDIHPDPDVLNTIRHEIAHALVGPNNGHNEVWQNKAKEIGCSSIQACSTLSMPEHVIDAIRSGASVEVSFDEEVIRTPKYKVTRLQDKCKYCGKVAKELSESLFIDKNDSKPDLKFIKLECGHTLTKEIPKGTPFHKFISNYDNLESVRLCKHEWTKNQCNLCHQYKPFDFQLEGMRHIERALASGKGCGIFDEMGLGKTIQALGYLKFHPEEFPVLYVVKSSIKFQWLKAILTWHGDMYMGQIIKDSKDYLIPGLKTYIISYDMMVFKTKTLKKSKKVVNSGFDIAKFDTVGIKTVVLDECQQIKNPDSSRTQQIRKLVKDRKVIPLSGTPWKNRGSEFYSALNIIDPIKFWSYAHYLKNWVDTYYSGTTLKYGGIKNPELFQNYIKDIAIRRERSQVMKELPLINRMRLYMKLEELEQETYDDEVSSFVKWYNEATISGLEEQLNGMHILAKMSRMRHLTGLAKIPATAEFTHEFVEETDRKLCIFVHHIDVTQLLFDRIGRENPDIPVIKITGDMNDISRFQTAENFNKLGRCILIASTLAAGEGLNLQTGADCIIHERQWNPANEEQAEGRFIRIGQTATSVNATYVLGEGTIDDLFDQIIEDKRNWFHSGMNKGEAGKWVDGDIAKNLAEAIVNKFNKRKNGSKK